MKSSELQTLEELAASAWPETKTFLRAMVEINSFSTHREGIRRMGECVAGQFADLGFDAEFVPHTSAAFGDHLVLRCAGPLESPTIALLAHLDTVFTEEEELRNAFAWREDGERIYGPGTNDIKGGIALMWMVLMAFRRAFPAVYAATNWVILSNACEEVDSTDFGRLCEEVLPRSTRACLIFEADGCEAQDFALVTARKGRATFRVEVHGRGAHAGGGHAHGVNAIVQLARIVEKLAALTDYGAGVTVNVARIQGGTVLNRVPERAVAELEMRSFAPEAFAAAKRQILALRGAGELCSGDADAVASEVGVDQMDETPPWPRNPATDALYAVYEKAAAELNVPIAPQQRGGLSDGNVLWQQFPTLDGLGPRGSFAHCSENDPSLGKVQEFVEVTSFREKAMLHLLALHLLLTRDEAPRN